MTVNKSYIERETEALLKRHNLFRAPVDVYNLAQKLGIKVEPKNLDDNVSGFLVKKAGESVIGVNSNHHEVRQRFTIAHEEGHFILHSETPLFVDDYKGSILYRATNKSHDFKKERQANMFAAALLMPKALIGQELKKIPFHLEYEQKLSRISDIFKVSQQAMDYRLKSLGHYEYGF